MERRWGVIGRSESGERVRGRSERVWRDGMEWEWGVREGGVWVWRERGERFRVRGRSERVWREGWEWESKKEKEWEGGVRVKERVWSESGEWEGGVRVGRENGKWKIVVRVGRVSEEWEYGIKREDESG